MKKWAVLLFIFSLSNSHAQFSQTYFDYDTLDANNIRLLSSNVGNSLGGFWEALSNNYWNQTIIYEHGPWLVGKIGIDTVLSLVQWYSTYSPGPILNGQAAMLIHPEDSLRYRVYKISKGDDSTNIDYAEWPIDFGAPVDQYGNPLVLGDQTLWTTFNSLDSTVTRNWWDESLDPFPVEFHQTVFGRAGFNLDETDIYSNTVFIEWEIINKGNSQIDSAYFGFWTDIDFDSYLENRPGIDTLLQSGYCWSNDMMTSYDSIPPAVGYVMLYGPIIPEQGSSAIFRGRTLSNHKNLNLTTFRGIIDDSTPPLPLISKVPSISGAWNVARGLTLFGDPILDPITNKVTTFPFSGDPVNSEGWIFDSGTSGGAGFMFFSGPFTLAPNDTQWTMIALIPAKGESNLNSITQMRRKAEILLSLPYDSLAFGTLSYPITDVEYEQNIVISNFKLKQNYPNPFNPSTTIKYQIPELSFVTLKVYDVLGNEITTLVNEEKTVGNYEVEFDALGLPSGIYFYRLQTPNFTQTKKMILLK